MRAQDLTDEDIGRVFWVQQQTGIWLRIRFLGFPRRIDPLANGGSPTFMILMAAPTYTGQQLVRFRRPGFEDFDGVMCQSAAEIYPVEIEYAVSADGEILEIGETAV